MKGLAQYALKCELKGDSGKHERWTYMEKCKLHTVKLAPGPLPTVLVISTENGGSPPLDVVLRNIFLLDFDRFAFQQSFGDPHGLASEFRNGDCFPQAAFQKRADGEDLFR